MEIAGRTALVTGGNRGLGRHLVEQLRDRGAVVYAAVRNTDSVDLAGVTPIRLDVTDEGSIAAAAEVARGVSILINNAGSSTGSSLLAGSLDDIRLEMETHYFGSLLVTRAFAGQLAEAEQSAVLNILSALSWFSFPAVGAYCAAKSAEWSMTNALRQELYAQGTVVSGLHVGYMDTDMTVGVKGPKSDPAVVARIALDGIEKGEVEILADEVSRSLRSATCRGSGGSLPVLLIAGA